MAVYKDEKRNTWYVRIKTQDELGKTKEIKKRGFLTKKEALSWETEKLKLVKGDAEMLFETFADYYKEYHFPRVRNSTAKIKGTIIDTHLVPYFGKYKMNTITVADVVAFQNFLLENDVKQYSKSYLATIQSVLSAMFNYGMRQIGLKSNPAKEAGGIGNLKSNSDQFWSLEQYKKFISNIDKGSNYYFMFEILYWTGIRKGEMLALTPADFDFAQMAMYITKTFYMMDGKEILAPTKTNSGTRVVILPRSLGEELREYIIKQSIDRNDRLFKNGYVTVGNKLKAVARKSGLKQIRIHDLRHSHASLLIKRGFSPVAVSSRLGHKGAYVVHRYVHMWPGTQKEIVEKLEEFA